MLTPSLINLTQSRIERTLTDLKREIRDYERLQGNFQSNVDRISRIRERSLISTYSQQNRDLILGLHIENNQIKSTSDRYLREIDCLAGKVAGYVSVLIDECIDNYTAKLKVWIRIRLNQLNELREINIQGVSNYLSFPNVVATLTPYLIKTRMCDDQVADKLVSIRNLIRLLSEPSC